MKTVKFNKKLPTIEGGARQVPPTNLTQEQLDERIRAAAKPHAVEEMVGETATTQTYQLSDGRLLRIWKVTGEVQIGCTKQ